MQQTQIDGLPWPRRGFAFAALVLAMTLTVMDSMAVAMALPQIAADFGIDPATSTWVVNGYQLAIISAMLPLSALSQIVGYHRVYLFGLILFAVMALVCSTTDSFGLLVAARALQAVGAASLMSVNLALLRHIFPSRLLGRALGVNAMAVALATTMGPTVAGVIMAVGSWQGIFLMGAVLALPAAAAGQAFFPRSERVARRFDFLGALFSAMTFGALLMTASAVAHGWSLWAALGFLLVGLGAGTLLVRHMRGDPAPLLPLDLLAIPVFRLSLMGSLCAFSSQMMMFVSLPFYLQVVLGMTALEAGLVFMAWPLALAVCAPLAGLVADRIPPGPLGMVGMGMMAAGLALVVALPEAPTQADIVWRLALCGAGFGLFQTPNNRAMMSAAPGLRSSAASGALGTARLLGQALGTAAAALALAGPSADGWVMAPMLGVGLCLTGAFVSILRKV